MGKQLESIYDRAKKMGGLVAQMRLAMLTLTPLQKARAVPDSPEYVQKFENALAKIQKELGKK